MRKQRDKGLAELQRLQHQRKEHADQQLNQARMLDEDSEDAPKPFDPAKFGFEFSFEKLERYIADLSKRDAIRNRTYYERRSPER